MYYPVFKKIEEIFIEIVFYGIPILVVWFLLLIFFDKINQAEFQSTFANLWFNLIVFILFIKPLSVIPSKYFKITKRNISDFFKYLIKWRTKDPILKYIWKLILNLIYSLSSYLLKFRRQFGILAFRSIFLHFSLLEISRYKSWNFMFLNFSNPTILMWTIWMIALFIGFLTSNNFSINLLKKYRKLIQSVSYIAFIFAVIHLFLPNPAEWSANIILLAIYILSKIFERNNFKSKKNSEQTNSETKYRKRICTVCGYIYDEALWDSDWWILPGTKFEDIPENRRCPICKVWKRDFKLLETTNLKKDSEPPKEKIKARVINRQMLTHNVLELTIETSHWVDVKPWQWAWFIFQDEQGQFERSYSISYDDTDNDKTILMFIIKVDENGRWWKILKQTKIWDEMTLKGLFWNFILQPNNNPKIFIATWTWLPPIMNIMRNTDVEKKLYFSVSKKADLFYEDQISKIKNLDYKIFITRENIIWYEFWRFDPSNLKFEKNTEFYICGNPIVSKDIISKLQNIWAKNIFSEEF